MTSPPRMTPMEGRARWKPQGRWGLSPLLQVGSVPWSIPSNQGAPTCTIDGDGTVTGASATGSCVVQARWDGDDNHNPSADVDIATITIVSAASPDPVWGTSPYGGSAVVDAKVRPTNSAISNLGSGVGRPQFRSQTPATCSVGDSTGGVTGIAAGAGVCIVEVRFVGNSSNGASAWVASPAISIGKGTPTVLSDESYYGASAQVALGERLELSSPPLIYGTAAYTVKSGSESHCEVDEASGVITGLEQGSCTIQVAFAGNGNYDPLTATDLQTVTVLDGNQQLTFSDPYGEAPALVVGGTLAIVNAPVATAGSGAGGAINYRESGSSTGICSVNANDGTVTGEAVGECTRTGPGVGGDGLRPNRLDGFGDSFPE